MASVLRFPALLTVHFWKPRFLSGQPSRASVTSRAQDAVTSEGHRQRQRDQRCSAADAREHRSGTGIRDFCSQVLPKQAPGNTPEHCTSPAGKTTPGKNGERMLGASGGRVQLVLGGEERSEVACESSSHVPTESFGEGRDCKRRSKYIFLYFSASYSCKEKKASLREGGCVPERSLTSSPT